MELFNLWTWLTVWIRGSRDCNSIRLPYLYSPLNYWVSSIRSITFNHLWPSPVTEQGMQMSSLSLIITENRLNASFCCLTQFRVSRVSPSLTYGSSFGSLYYLGLCAKTYNEMKRLEGEKWMRGLSSTMRQTELILQERNMNVIFLKTVKKNDRRGGK